MTNEEHEKLIKALKMNVLKLKFELDKIISVRIN